MGKFKGTKQINLDLLELLTQRNELLNMLKRIHKHAESMNLAGGIDHNEIKQLIENIENHESTSSPSHE